MVSQESLEIIHTKTHQLETEKKYPKTLEIQITVFIDFYLFIFLP